MRYNLIMNQISNQWKDYEVIDTGNKEKLEPEFYSCSAIKDLSSKSSTFQVLLIYFNFNLILFK